MIEEYEPQILTVGQNREFMEITLAYDLELLTPAALNCFLRHSPIRGQAHGEKTSRLNSEKLS